MADPRVSRWPPRWRRTAAVSKRRGGRRRPRFGRRAARPRWPRSRRHPWANVAARFRRAGARPAVLRPRSARTAFLPPSLLRLPRRRTRTVARRRRPPGRLRPRPRLARLPVHRGQLRRPSRRCCTLSHVRGRRLWGRRSSPANFPLRCASQTLAPHAMRAAASRSSPPPRRRRRPTRSPGAAVLRGPPPLCVRPLLLALLLLSRCRSASRCCGATISRRRTLGGRSEERRCSAMGTGWAVWM